MSDTILKLPSDTLNTGKNVDLEALVVGANAVVRERIQIAGAGALEILRIKGTIPLAADMGIVTRPIGGTDSGGADMTDPVVHAMQVSIVKEIDNILHDSPDGGGPNKIGARAIASVSAQAAVSANDRSDVFSGVDGVLLMRPDCNLEDILTGTLSNTDGSSVQLIAAQAAGIKAYLRTLDLYNSSGAGVVVDLKDGATIKKTFYVPATGGLIRRFDPPLPGTAATAWNVDAQVATTTLYANGEGFKSKL